MTKEELSLHLSEIRKMQDKIKELYSRIDSDRTDDGWRLRSRYDTILTAIRGVLIGEYDVERGEV